MHIFKRKSLFTLIELIVAMSVLVVIMSGAITMFTATTKSTDLAKANVMMYENANMALDLMTSDIQSIYFGNNTPFWHWRPPDPATADWGEFSNELLAFISATTAPQNDESSSLHEVKYQLFYTTDKANSNYGWLRRSVTGNKNSNNNSNSNWNFTNSAIHIGFDNTVLASTSLTANSSSSSDYQKLIPYVTSLQFTCYGSSGTEIPAHDDINQDNSGYGLGPLTGSGLYPCSIQVDLTVMDKNSWNKWIDLDIANAANTVAFRQNNERTFSKMIHIGDRIP